MKKFYIIILLVSIFSISCEKQELPSDEYSQFIPSLKDSKRINRFGKYVVRQATLYLVVKNTGEKRRYKHFSENKTRSCLNIGGSNIDFENIVKDSTTYSFTSDKKFIVNGVKTYDVFYTGSFISISVNGSTRPIECYTYDYDKKQICIDFKDRYGQEFGTEYWTRVILEKIEEY